MVTYKRRIIYLTDEQWAELRNEADSHKQTISALVRDWLRDLWADPYPERHGGPIAAIRTEEPRFAQFRPAPKPSQRHG